MMMISRERAPASQRTDGTDEDNSSVMSTGEITLDQGILCAKDLLDKLEDPRVKEALRSCDRFTVTENQDLTIKEDLTQIQLMNREPQGPDH